MEPLLSLLVGLLFGVAIYLMLGRSFVRIVLGIIVLSNAVNLLILTAGRILQPQRDIPWVDAQPVRPPLIPEPHHEIQGIVANPLPQALILTAIVIGFSLLAFLLVLTWRAHTALQTLDTDAMRVAEPPESPDPAPQVAP